MKKVFGILRDKGVNIDEAIEQVGEREDLYLIVLSKFTNDSNIYMLKELVDNKDFEKAMLVAHTLKGVYASLYFMNEYLLSSNIVKELRMNITDNIQNEVMELYTMHMEKLQILNMAGDV